MSRPHAQYRWPGQTEPVPLLPPRAPAAAESGGRRNTRSRKVSQKLAVVDESTRQQAVQARLDALENDNTEAQDPFGLGEDDDDEFVLASDGDEGARAAAWVAAHWLGCCSTVPHAGRGDAGRRGAIKRGAARPRAGGVGRCAGAAAARAAGLGQGTPLQPPTRAGSSRPPPRRAELELGGKRKRKGAGGGKRKTRAMRADTNSKVPKTFAKLLEDVSRARAPLRAAG